MEGEEIMKDKTIIAIGAIVSILILDIFALSLGYNGTGLMLAIASIAGIAGYEVKNVIERIKKT